MTARAASDLPFTDAEAARAWNEGSDAYDAFVESGDDYYRHHVHGPALLAACEPVAGVDALDLGCGQGYFARQLAGRGARVVGVELAAGLVERARARESATPLGIEYHAISAAEIGDRFPEASVDLVTACMSLQDMADVPRTLAGARRVLRPDGRLVFSVPHPATDLPLREWARAHDGRKLYLELDGYFDTGATTCRWNMARLRYHWTTPCWRHTLAEWFSLVTRAGFALTLLDEPRATAEQAVANPRLADCRRMPYFLILGARAIPRDP